MNQPKTVSLQGLNGAPPPSPLFFFFFFGCFVCFIIVMIPLSSSKAGPRIAPFSSSASRSVMVNSRVQMSCVIEEGDPPFTIRWLRNGRPVTMTPSSSSMSGIRVTDFNAYSSILTVDQVGVHHGGNYTCRAENAAGSALHAALLQVSGIFLIIWITFLFVWFCVFVA